MARIKVDTRSASSLAYKLSFLNDWEVTRIGKQAVYAGAGFATDRLRSAIDRLRRVPDVDAINAWWHNQPTFICVSQKNGLRESLGIATFRVRLNVIETKVGFTGYNSVRTRKYPNGQPNRMIAATCNHGTAGYMIRQPFITVTVEVFGTEIRKKMRDKTNDELKKALN